MFQTVLYVIGPFLLYAGAGVGCVWAARQYVVRVILPRGRLASRRLARAERAVDQNRRCQRALGDLVQAMESNPPLRAAIPEDVRAAVYSLATEASATQQEDH